MFRIATVAAAVAAIGWKWAALTYTMLEYSTDNGDTWYASSFGVSLSMPMVRF